MGRSQIHLTTNSITYFIELVSNWVGKLYFQLPCEQVGINNDICKFVQYRFERNTFSASALFEEIAKLTHFSCEGATPICFTPTLNSSMGLKGFLASLHVSNS